MKQKPEHQTVVIDMNADEVPLPRPSRLPSVLALLALLVTAAAIALGYHYWQNLQQDLQRLAARIQSTARVQQELQQNIRQAQQALESNRRCWPGSPVTAANRQHPSLSSRKHFAGRPTC